MAKTEAEKARAKEDWDLKYAVQRAAEQDAMIWHANNLLKRAGHPPTGVEPASEWPTSEESASYRAAFEEKYGNNPKRSSWGEYILSLRNSED